jgi:hypothetical protein
MPAAAPLSVAPDDLAELRRWTRSSRLPAVLVQRARILLLAADGVANTEIAERMCLAGHAPAHPAALHADLGVVAEPSRGVLLDRGASGAAPRQLRQRDRPHRRHRRFCVAWNHHCQPFAWTKPANEILAKLNRQTRQPRTPGHLKAQVRS